ncbi:ballchen, partial [Danaus plexippus plexippus]
ATKRGDLEILGYNMLQWLVGELPWEKNLKQPKTVQAMKEAFMNNVRKEITRQFNNVPEALTNFFEYINSLKPKDSIDYTKCRQMFENYLKSEGVAKSKKMDFAGNKKRKTKKIEDSSEHLDPDDNTEQVLKKNTARQNGEVRAVRRGRKVQQVPEEDGENKEPADSVVKQTSRAKKRNSIEPSVVVKLRKTRMAPKAKTQTSVEKNKRSPRQVSFDSPISEVIGEKNMKRKNDSMNSSGDIFDDSFVIEEKKARPRRKLISDEEVIVKRVVRKKVTSVTHKTRSWRDSPAVMNGRSPPK